MVIGLSPSHSTFPRLREAIAENFAGLGEETVHRVTSENCARLY